MAHPRGFAESSWPWSLLVSRPLHLMPPDSQAGVIDGWHRYVAAVEHARQAERPDRSAVSRAGLSCRTPLRDRQAVMGGAILIASTRWRPTSSGARD